MHIYLPIAELSANIYALIALGGVTGLLSGLFGIGGGFILTPMLIFLGVPPAVSVATSTNMIVASSFSGFLSHLKYQRVDLQMGAWLIAGGLLGATGGVIAFSSLQRAGQVDLFITLLYVSLLGSVSYLMAKEARQMLHAHQRGEKPPQAVALALPGWVIRLPWQKTFERSRVTHSVLVPISLGVISGLLVGLLGVGGGFIMIPMMVYILRMPLHVTVGTSLFQIIFITAVATLLHATTSHAVDIMLAILLLLGSTVGAQFGVRFSQRIPGYWLRGLMSVLLILVAGRLAYGLFITPSDVFTAVIE